MKDEENAPPAVGAPLDLPAVFAALPGIDLVLAADAPRFTILAATDARLAATMTTRAGSYGRPLFEVFPNANPANDAPSGVANLRASLETVLRTRRPHRMAVQRYDLQGPDGAWEERHWEPLNVPVLGAGGDVRYIIHRVADVTDRVRAEAEAVRLGTALQAERERLRSVIGHMPAAVALTQGPEHRVTLVNDAYRRTSGAARDVTGLAAHAAFPALAGTAIHAHLDRVYATGEPWAGREERVRLPREGGAVDAWVVARVEPVRDGDGRVWALLTVLVDVTAEVQARHDVERLLAESERARGDAEAARADAERARERTALLQQLTAALSTASTPGQVAEAVVRYATPVLDAAGTVIARLTADGQQLEIMQAEDMPPDVRGEWRRFPISAPVPLAEAARTARPVFLESRAAWAERYPGTEGLLVASGHHANAVLPLVADGRVLGVLGAAFGAPRAFDADDRTLAAVVAQQCAHALERARLLEQAQSANRAKSEFLAVMSHELRTPLNAIGGYADLMEMGIRGPVTDQQRDDLRRVQASQRHLLGLINEVLNYAKLETGVLRYDIADVAMAEALGESEALVAPQARAKELTLEVTTCPPGLASRADPEKLRQILVNLLSNAVKFTGPGGRVTMECAAADGAGGDRADDRGAATRGCVRVRVHDTGIGIPADKLTAVFEPFVQVRADLRRPHEGTGLGLAISRDLARGMGGDLTAESTLGAGSVFTLTLPSA